MDVDRIDLNKVSPASPVNLTNFTLPDHRRGVATRVLLLVLCLYKLASSGYRRIATRVLSLVLCLYKLASSGYRRVTTHVLSLVLCLCKLASSGYHRVTTRVSCVVTSTLSI
jgi:hypothetical protein